MSCNDVKKQEKQGIAAGKNNKENKWRWVKPAILSTEPLEAAATICEPANAPFGKDYPGTCGTLGS